MANNVISLIEEKINRGYFDFTVHFEGDNFRIASKHFVSEVADPAIVLQIIMDLRQAADVLEHDNRLGTVVAELME